MTASFDAHVVTAEEERRRLHVAKIQEMALKFVPVCARYHVKWEGVDGDNGETYYEREIKILLVYYIWKSVLCGGLLQFTLSTAP